jgi:tRNA pseudouridine55 synthase
MATGLLVLCLGNATRLVEYMIGHDKRYEGEITLGVTTDTDDAEGAVLASSPVPAVTRELLDELRARFSGAILQTPPAYSALKIAGQRSYRLARAGEAPEHRARPVAVHELVLEATGTATLGIAVHCGPGTYIRSLARDVGEVLGCGAHLSALRRTAVGGFALDDAWEIDTLTALADSGRFEEALRPADEGLAGALAALVTDEHAALLRHGGQFVASGRTGEGPEPTRIYNAAGEFVGVGAVAASGLVQAIKVLL